MKNKLYACVGLVFILAVSACKGPQPITKNNSVSIDFTKYRIQYADSSLTLDAPVRPKNGYVPSKALLQESDYKNYQDVNEELDSHLRKISYQNQRVKYFRGYVVQIYSGGNRQEANDHIRNVRAVTDEDVQLQYKEPNYKVQVGNYLDRTQAHYTYTQVQELFPSAVIVQSKVELKRYKYDNRKTVKEEKYRANDQR